MRILQAPCIGMGANIKYVYSVLQDGGERVDRAGVLAESTAGTP